MPAFFIWEAVKTILFAPLDFLIRMVQRYREEPTRATSLAVPGFLAVMKMCIRDRSMAWMLCILAVYLKGTYGDVKTCALL